MESRRIKCITRERTYKYIQNFSMNPEEKRSCGKTGKVLRATLKRIFKKHAFKLWTGPSEHGNECSGAIKRKGFLEKLSGHELLKKKSAPWGWLDW
jgi:hypothetical protein